MWTVTTTPVGKHWHIEVEGLTGATQARNSRDIEDMAKDFIALKTGQSPESIAIEVQVIVPSAVRALLVEADKLNAESDRTRKAAALASRNAARELSKTGMTVRDVGFALGVSFQRAQQLIKR